MSDGRIQIDIEIDGKPVKMVISDLKDFESAAKKSAGGSDEVKKSMKDIDGKKVKETSEDFKDLAGSSKKSAKDVDNVKDAIKGVDGKPLKDTKENMNEFNAEATKGQKTVKDFVIALGLVKVASMAFNVLKDSMSSAIDRFDTLEKFPRVLQSMGFEAQQSERAMERMSNSIEGLPTTLNDMVGLTQKFVNITGDLDKSVNTAEALNNAMLASGSSSADAARGIEQYSQMLANGEPDMQSWKSTNETMGYGLKRTAEEMLGAGSTAIDLYKAIKSGEITMDEVNDKIIELGGSTGELADLARKNSEGISTSFSNLKNSAVKGLANVMKSMNTVIEKATGKSIAKNLDSLKGVVNSTFNKVNKTIESSVPIVEALAKVFGVLVKATDTLSPALKGLFVAYAGVKIVEQTKRIFENSNKTIFEARKAVESLEKVTLTLTAAKAKELAALELSDAATKQEIATALASNGVITMKTALLAVMTGAMTRAEFASLMLSKTTLILKGAMDAMVAHPVVATIAALVLVMTAASKISRSMNKEFYESNKKIRDMTDGVKDNSKATTDNIRERQTKIQNLDKETAMSKGLVDRIDELTKSEKASTDGKKEIKQSVEELNRLYPDLDLAYDENTNKINHNAEAIKSQIDAMSSYDKVMAVQENMKTATKELSEAEAEQTRIASDLIEIRKQQGEVNFWSVEKMLDLKKTEKELMEQEEANGERRKSLTAEQKALLEQQSQAREESLAMQKSAIEQAGLQYDFLGDKQKAVVDRMKENYQDMLGAASSFTNDLSYELDMTGQELINFVEKNQTIMTQWGDNLKALTERGANDGWIEQLRNMGPEGAKYAQIAVNMSDQEFNKMNELFAGAPKVSEESWKKAFGMENIDSAVAGLVFQGKTTLERELASADFGSLGINVAQGAAKGVNDGAKEFSDATGNMAKEGANTFKSENQIHSPSRLYYQFGGFIGQGLAQGIIASDSLTKAAMARLSASILVGGTKMLSTTKNVASLIPNQFNGLQGELSSIGQQAMSGLNSGLISGSGTVMSTARQIANNIAETMKAALDIHSPSRVMRNQIGRFIPQGIALGIEDDAQKAYAMIERLKGGLMARIKPETALNVSGMGYASMASNVINNSDSSPITVSNQGMFDGAVIHASNDESVNELAGKVSEKILSDLQTAKKQVRV